MIFALALIAALAGFALPAGAQSGAGQVACSAGSGNICSLTYPDQEGASAAITTATTTLIVAGVSGQNIYIYAAGAYTTGTNSGAAFGLAYGPNASTLTYLFDSSPASAINVGAPATAGLMALVYSGTSTASGTSIVPASVPRVIPTGQNLYIVTIGTTIALKGYALYAIHG